MNKRSFIYALGVTLAFLVSAHAAQAETEFTSVPLEELMEMSIASITKMEMPLNKSPVTAFVITQDEINRKGFRYLADILKNTPGIYATNMGTSESYVAEIYIRGLNANNKLALLVDGIKVKSPTGESINFLNAIPLIGVRQVEISFGSSSSIYGADAMLGTINLVMQDGAALNGASVKATAGNASTGEVQLAAGYKLTSDLSWSLTSSFHRSAGEDILKNYPAEYNNIGAVDVSDKNHNVHFKVNYKDLVFSYYRTQTRNNSSVGYTPYAPGLYDYSGAAFWEALNQTVNATYAWNVNQFWQAKSSLSYERNETLPQSSFRDYGTIEHKASLGEAIRFSQNAIYQRDKTNWLSGIELTYLNSTPKYTVEDPLFNKVNINYQNCAAFSQLDYAWREGLNLSASLRMDSDSRYTPVYNPRLGFSWQAQKSLRLFGAWGTSYLAPAPVTIYEKWGYPGWGTYLRPNTNLQPEKISTYELGMDIAPEKNSSLKLLGFYTSGKDLIRVVDKAGTGLPNYSDNVAKSNAYGMQAIAEQRFDNGVDLNFDYTLTLGSQDAEKIANGQVGLSNVPEHMIKGNVIYTRDRMSYRFTGRWFDKVGTHESNTLYAGTSAPGGLIFDTNIHYIGQSSAIKWSADLGINNLFNKKYYAISIFDNTGSSLPRLPQEKKRLYLTLGLSL